MATLSTLSASEKIIRFSAELEPDEMPNRFIYMAGDFVTWAEDVLYAEEPDENGGISPYEQVEGIFHHFVVGRPLCYGVHKKLLRPETRGVWSIRTKDVRVFGWFPAQATFLAVSGALKRSLRECEDYAPHIDKVAQFREELPLDEPKSVGGTRPDEIA